MVLFCYYKVIIKINFSEKAIKELSDEEAKAIQKIFSELSEKMSPDDFKKLIDEIDFSNPKYIEEIKGIADGLGVEVEGLMKELDKLVVSGGKTFKNGDTIPKEMLETKPMNSPVPEKWINKGGSITIDSDGIWTYTNKNGQFVKYTDGYPDFTPYSHPDIEPVQIEVASPANPTADFKAANEAAGLNKDSIPPVTDIRRPPEGFTWHHHEDGKTMILVDEDIHREFRHIGGQSTVNGKNSK